MMSTVRQLKATPAKAPPQDFLQVWKTIELGTHKDNAALRQALVDGGFLIGGWPSEILKKVTVAPEPTTLDLVRVKVAELGFPNGAYFRDIYPKAQLLGLELCPAEVGPQLRLQYPDQPAGEWIWVAMAPIVGTDAGPGVFRVGHDGGKRWLGSVWARPGRLWDGSRQWVFVGK